jgi:hypothetical protein
MDEQQLFEVLRDNQYEDLVLVSNDEYSACDAFSESYKIYVELKCRAKHYEELMIEKLKYERFKGEADNMGFIPLYICSTPEGIWEFNLDVITIDWQDMENLPATTQFSNTDKVTKTVGFLPVNKGTPILIWYPEYNNESEYFAQVLANESEFLHVDPAEYDITDGPFEEWYNKMLEPNKGWL